MAAETLVPDRRTLERAARMIGPYVRRTPARPVGDGLWFKLELEQHTGSFKPRGAFHSVLHDDVAPTRLVAASGGNHGLAAAHVGRVLGIPVEVFVPEVAPAVKVAGLRSLGAVVHQAGATYAEALDASRALAERPGTLVLHAYDGLRTVAGQGTVGLEIEEQVADVDTVVVAVGGGGLVGGVAAWAATRPVPPRVVAVETAGCPALHEALAAGRPVEVTPSGLAADSLGASRVGDVGLAAVTALPDVRSLLVDDEQVRSARRALWADHQVATEAGGATAWAALHSGVYAPHPGERVVVVVCGGNADHADLPGWPGSPR